MTHEKLDRLWFQAMEESIKDNEMVARYHFASLVAAAEREACAKVCEELWYVDGTTTAKKFAAAIRARSNT